MRRRRRALLIGRRISRRIGVYRWVRIYRRVKHGVGGIRQARPILVLPEQFEADIATHREHLPVGRKLHRRLVDFAVARVEDRAAPYLSSPSRFMPRMISSPSQG